MDRSSTPDEKLWIRAKQAEEFGKEFNEVNERAVLGLPPVPGTREPIFIAENRDRTKLTLAEDQKELRELLAAREQAGNASVGDALDEKQSEIDELRRQNAELDAQLGGNLPQPKKAEKEPTDIGTGAGSSHDHPDGLPDKSWSKAKVRNFMKHYEIPEPSGGSTKMSNTGLLDYVLEQADKLELFETKAPKE